jgi:hypothetical protein
MFEGLNNDLVGLVLRLFPGFLTAWIFYGLTAHDRPQPFERVIQALVFSTIIQSFTVIARVLALGLGRFISLGRWNDDSTLVCSVFFAVLLGFLLARFANNGSFHDWLRDWEWWNRRRKSSRLRWLFFFDWSWTTRTSYPSEWYGAFSSESGRDRYVILHLKGERRLLGFPVEWPDRPGQGHFVIHYAAWLKDDDVEHPLTNVVCIVIPARDVAWVEFLKHDDEETE